MEKFYLVQQPPLSEKFRMIVDDIDEYATFAITTDVDKVMYNRKILGQDLDIHLETYTALSDKGITTVLPIGRYVTIWEISKDERKQTVCYVDYDTEVKFREVSGTAYSNNVYDQFESIQEQMRSHFRETDDIIELILAPRSA